MVEIAILGTGHRGARAYGEYILKNPEKAKVVAICDIDRASVLRYKEVFDIEENKAYFNSDDFFKAGRLAKGLIIATPDNDHYEHCMKAIELGYDILLEKPISGNIEECCEIEKKASEKGVKIIVCHVLRYTPYFKTIKSIIDSGEIGEVKGLNQTENIVYWHYALSFVRGRLSNTTISSPLSLQKTCHDFDIISFLLNDECEKLSSYGDLSHFKKENAPDGCAERCIEDCSIKNTCPYNCERFYYDWFERMQKDANLMTWPLDLLVLDATKEKIKYELENNPQCKCVYHCDNNVCDHQIVNMIFKKGTFVSFTVSAFTERSGRDVDVFGTKGQIVARECEGTITVYPFGVAPRTIDLSKLGIDVLSGHGGGDDQMMKEFLDLLEGEKIENTLATTIDKSIHSHIISLAADLSRKENGRCIKL